MWWSVNVQWPIVPHQLFLDYSLKRYILDIWDYTHRGLSFVTANLYVFFISILKWQEPTLSTFAVQLNTKGLSLSGQSRSISPVRAHGHHRRKASTWDYILLATAAENGAFCAGRFCTTLQEKCAGKLIVKGSRCRAHDKPPIVCNSLEKRLSRLG